LTDFVDALHRNALPSIGMTLVIIGATFRWFESASRFLTRLERRTDPFSRTRAHVAHLRESGNHAQARLAEEPVHDQLRRMRRYGGAMMIVGVAIVFVSALLYGWARAGHATSWPG
jgi:uncharacterized protein YjeT (DUF2065 family)